MTANTRQKLFKAIFYRKFAGQIANCVVCAPKTQNFFELRVDQTGRG